MAKKQQQNKIGDSFEQNLPDELVPDFIWENISNTLDHSKTPTESTEKIKASFEEGFDEAAVPPFLWTGIESSLKQASPVSSTTGENKIKTSFEGGHQDPLPENLWENVETQLEIEGVWKRVLNGLNKRTKRQYWQEKGMQFGIAALALLLLRGCDFGEWSPITPIANQSKVTAQVEEKNAPILPVLTSNSNIKKNDATSPNATTPITTKNNQALNSNLFEPTYTLATVPAFSAFSKTASKANLANTNPFVEQNTNAFILVGTKSEEEKSNLKENLSTPSVNNKTVLYHTPILEEKENKTLGIPANSGLVNKTENSSNKTTNRSLEAKPTKARTTVINKNNNNKNNNKNTANILASKTIVPSKNPIDVALNSTAKKTNENTTASKNLLSETPISTLKGQAFIDPTIEHVASFEIDNVVNKKKHNIRFELGMNGKVGTSLLLGNATNKAMETTSMVKTKTRAAGGIGIMLDCYLTANDAIVFGAYPLSNSQQYFGGYTNEGRYYHKEVKLAYFDFTLGYQRTLFHYNDFGTIPSSMYARLDYGLGYLSKSEEIINGLAAELGDSYNKLNHNVGLTIGNTHRINRFVIDYGIYGNIGLSSVQNVGPLGTTSVEYSNLATMGGYLGLRYVL